MRPITKKKPGPPTKPKPTDYRSDKENSPKEPVQVFARLRPIKNIIDSVSLRKVPGSDNLLQVTQNGCAQQVYEFKRVFDEHCSQKEVFDNVAFPLVQDLINGNNGLIFTYGVTSSGKTHTITGTPSNCGILPRTLDTLFNTLDRNDLQSIKHIFRPDGQNGFEISSTPDAILKLQGENNITMVQQQKQFSTPGKFTSYSNSNVPRTPRSVRKNNGNNDQLEMWENRERDADQFVNEINCDNNFAVFVSYVEVYNNYIYDLLDDSFDTVRSNGVKQPRPKNIREDSKKKVFVVGVNEVEVKSANEAFELFIKGIRRRRMGTTQLNSESSRSHSVFTIRLTQAPLDLNGTELLDNKNYIHVSQLSIVDLAGCERTARTQATGNRLKEASNINNSLMNLRNCFDILRENQKTNSNKMVPYRDNKLTHLFKSYFEGDGKVEMVICINPGQEDFDETMQVLKFAEVSQEITTTATKGGVSRYPFNQQIFRNGIQNVNYELAPINSIGPPYPDRYLEDPEDNYILAEWMDCLNKRIANQDSNNKVNKQNQMMVRQHIVELEQTAMMTQQKLSVAQMDLDARENQLKDYENKFVQMDRQNEALLKRVSQLEQANAQQFDQISLKERICSQLQGELEHLRMSMSDRLKEEKDRLKRWCIRLMNEKRLELEREKCIEQDKIARVKQILNNGSDNQDLFAAYQHLTSPPRAQPTTPPRSNERARSPEQSRPKTRSQSNDRQNGIGLNAPLSPTAHAPPVCNPRHRRSLSAGGEKWIDHRPPGTIELGTILRPKIKNKKSVTNLKASDFIDNSASKYALTHHEATESGSVETKVFKGEVIPSSTGGAQIIFNDVETLKQNSPSSLRKRYGDCENGGTNNGGQQSSSSSKQHHHREHRQQQRVPTSAMTSSRNTTPGTNSSSGRSRSHQTTPCNTEPMSELHQFLSKRSRQH